MSEHLKKFLADLASDAERMGRFEVDPAGELAGTKLSQEERRALLSRDSARLRQALGATGGRQTFIRGIKKLKRGIKDILDALELIERKEEELKEGARKRKGKGKGKGKRRRKARGQKANA
jgi:hypothetical protein